MDIPFAPTFEPSAEEFQDPLKYIASIRAQAAPFGESSQLLFAGSLRAFSGFFGLCAIFDSLPMRFPPFLCPFCFFLVLAFWSCGMTILRFLLPIF